VNLRLLKKEFVIHVVERLDLGTLSEAELLRNYFARNIFWSMALNS
jgi:hypothetical protein